MSIGIWQLVLIIVIILLIFGAGKIPTIMSDIAKGIKSFKNSMDEDDNKKGSNQEDDKKK